MAVILAFLIGIVAGARAMTAPAIISWAAWLGLLPLQGTLVAFLGYQYTPFILTLLALFELVSDQLPATPSRKVPIQFGTRLLMGALTGFAVAAPAGSVVLGLVAGIVGAVIGTLGGAALRAALAERVGNHPAAFIEDALAIGLAVIVVLLL